MATLKQGVEIDARNIHVDLFEAEEGGSLLEAFLVEDGRLVLVKEILPEGMGYTFFEIETQERIEKSIRYDDENGKLLNDEIDENHKSVCEVIVDPKTGFEKLIETVFKDSEIIYKNTRERYSSGHTKPLLTRCLAYQKQKETKDRQVADLVKKFTNSMLDGKVDILRGIFRKEWRNRCELGFEQPELFLSDDLYAQFSRVKQFKEALIEMLKLEERTVDVDASKLYSSILANYEGLIQRDK
jgi:hypothetical protein